MKLSTAISFVCITMLMVIRLTADEPSAEKHQSNAPTASPPKTLDVRLLDLDGKPVEGALVGTFSSIGGKRAQPPFDEEGWSHYPNALSDADGKARVSDEYGIYQLAARHVGRKLAALAIVGSEQEGKTLTLTMHPQCKLFGSLGSKELEARNRPFVWSNVYLYLDDKHRAMMCQSEKREFHFFVPPGTYQLHAYSMDTHTVVKQVTVEPDKMEMDVGVIDMPPKQLALLEGRPAPELRDVAAWKNSEPLRLADLRGRVVLLVFWGYWCGPCVGEMPDLFALHDKYHTQGLEVIAIHVSHGDVESVTQLDEKLAPIKQNIWANRDIPFPVALARHNETPHLTGDNKKKAPCQIAADYGITGYPTCVLIDRHGRVLGAYYYKEAELQKALKEKL